MIPVFKPSIRRKDMSAVLDCLVSDSIGPGRLGDALVFEAASYLELDGGAAYRNYPWALGAALDCLDLPNGAGVIISPLSPAFYIEILQSRGLMPLYCDTEPDVPCMDPEGIRHLAEEGAAAILLHTPLGYLPEMEKVRAFGLPLIEDISQSLGAHTGEGKAGRYGVLTLISTEEDGIITSGGGGILLSSSRKYFSRIKALKEGKEGMETDSALYLMPDINAALGLNQIRLIENFIHRRKEIAGLYMNSVMKTRHRGIVQAGEGESVYYSFPVLVKDGMKEIRQYARKKGVDTSMAFSRSIMAQMESDEISCPNSRSFLLRTLLFPLYPMLGKKDAETICRILTTLP